MTPIRFRVVPQEEGMMLGQLVTRRIPDLTAEQGRALVKAGAVYMGHLRVRIPTVRVVPGERITVYRDALDEAESDPATLSFVHRDPNFVVLDKPAGVPVAATKQSARGTLSEALRRQLETEGVLRPYVGVVHRLDRGASGLVLMTIRSIANKSLHQQFVDHRICRTYRVLVHGDAAAEATCDAALVERPGGGMRVANSGESRRKEARTHFRKVQAQTPRPGTSLMQVELETGRTHQIRVHAAKLGWPVVGDRRYGNKDGEPERLHLHAWALDFAHPIGGERIQVASQLPPWALAVHEENAR